MTTKAQRKKEARERAAREQAAREKAQADVAETRSPEATFVKKAEEAAGQAGVAPVPPISAPTEKLDELKTQLAGVIEGYKAAHRTAEEREAEAAELAQLAEDEKATLQAERRKLVEVESDLAVQRSALEDEKSSVAASRKELGAELAGAKKASKRLATDEGKLDELRATLLDREEEIARRQADADAGFIARREEVLSSLSAAHDKLLSETASLAARLESERQGHVETLQMREEEHRTRLQKAEDDLAARFRGKESALETWRATEQTRLDGLDEALRTREVELETKARKAEWAKREAEETLADLQEHIAEKAEERLRDVQAQLEVARKLGDGHRDRAEELAAQLAARADAERALDHESPEAVRQRIESQQTRIKKLEDELANRLSQSDGKELLALRDEHARWLDERRDLLTQLQEVERKLATRQIAVDETESLRAQVETLRENKRLLQAAVDELRRDIDDRLDKYKDQPVFPEMLRMEDDPDLQDPPQALFSGPMDGINLKDFAADLRHRIGRDPAGRLEDLFYRPEDIRSLLGGLSMSRLHLMQGISGIGKSSLPRRFAEAVGGLCVTVSVQAGWRDRNDLFGHFNAFERRYYESTFVQALAKAWTPQWQDRLVVVLLDEMNLSHPEQYAADVLDVLERSDPRDRRFELMSSRQGGDCPAIIEEGRYLPLPENVWFVGTANHDETTKDFADKTYDRSFVLELPDLPAPFALSGRKQRDPVSHGALTEAFEQAQEQNPETAKAGLAWLKKNLQEPMADFFGVSWGGRLRAQAGRYMPVIEAAGGSRGEALDRLVATRVLRRLRGRHDLQGDDLRHLHTIFETKWIEKDGEATECSRLLRRELKRIGEPL